MTSTKRRHEKAYALYKACLHWQRGALVTVRRDNGETIETALTVRPWFSRGSAYVRVRGIPGNTRLSRVSLAKGGG